MARIFLGIASSEYDDIENLPNLSGVTIDGRNVSEALFDQSIGDYDKDISKVLSSPTLLELNNAIEEILFIDDKIECFTLYFAGHGISVNGAYYLCLKDTNCDRISATALALSHIFNVINDVRPIQTNIIIDACEAGGLVDDLGTLIKQEVFGYKNSPSVSLFGSSLKDQDAREDNNGGFATQALLKYIKGEQSIDTWRPYLDLVYIGRFVSEDLMDLDDSQTPVVWGFNLTGISTFVKNRNFKLEASMTTSYMPSFINTDIELLQNEKEKIWYEYLKITEKGSSPDLVHTLVRSVNDLKAKDMDPIKIASFLVGTADGFALRVSM